TKGPSIMGFEDEVEQSFGRPCRQCDGRFKRTYELTSSIVPRIPAGCSRAWDLPPVVRAQLALRLRPALATPVLANCASKVWGGLTNSGRFVTSYRTRPESLAYDLVEWFVLLLCH